MSCKPQYGIVGVDYDDLQQILWHSHYLNDKFQLLIKFYFFNLEKHLYISISVIHKQTA